MRACREDNWKHFLVDILVFLEKKAEDNPVNLLIIFFLLQPSPDCSESHTAGSSIGVAIDTSGYAWEGNAFQAVMEKQRERAGVAAGEHLWVFTLWAYSGDDIPNK